MTFKLAFQGKSMVASSHSKFHRSPLTLALAAAMLLPAGAAVAQQQTTPSQADQELTEAQTAAAEAAKKEKAKTIDGVTVVGSRIKRVAVEGPAPVVIISREEIEREGFKTVGDMLQTITQNTTSSFTGDEFVNGFSPNAQVVNLRNLGPGYTLTLINGRRPAQYPQPYNRDNNVVNIRAIPSSIIERVEILTGGASAIYGSDAVAGVVNIVTRKNFDGNAAKVTLGTTEGGGGDSLNLELAGGRTGDRWSAMYALQFGDTDPVFASERDFLADSRNGPNGAGFSNPSLSLVALRGSNPATGRPLNHNAFYPGAAVCDQYAYTTVTTPARGQYCGSFNQVASRSISNKNRFYSAYTSGTFDLTDNLQLFGSATYYASDASSSSGTEFWGTGGDQFNRTRLNGQTSFYFDPSFGHLVQLQRVFNPFELGGEEAAVTLYDESTYDVNVGIMGTFADRFDWEASLSHSEYLYSADRPRLLAKGVHDYFLGPLQGFSGGTPGSVGNFPIYTLNRANWTKPLTPEIYQSFSTRVVNEGETGSSTFNFNIAGELFNLPAGPVGFAGVLEAGRQTVDLRSDPRLDQNRPRDDHTVYNLTSSGITRGERQRYALGAEFRVPVFTKLTAMLAARYDKYEDITEVDDAVSYMAGLEYRPFSNLLLRGSYSTSFRAPDMQLVFAEGAASFSGIFDQLSCRAGTGPAAALGPRTITQCANAPGDPTRYTAQTLIAGNPLLKEEEGTSWGGGFVWDITNNMSFSSDYYRIELKDQALQLSTAFLLDNEANCRLGVKPDGSPSDNASDSSFCQNIYGLITRQSAPGTALDQTIQRINSAYINAALSDTSGIDSTFRYGFDLVNLGRFRLDLAYTIVLTDKYKQFDNNPLIDFRDNIFNSNSRSRGRGSLNWTRGEWSSTVFGTRYGSVGSAAGAAGTNLAGISYPRRLEPFMLYNFQVAKRFGTALSVTGTVNNVFDNNYRYDASQTGYPFYNSFKGSDPLGRRYQLSVAYRF